MKIQFMSDLHLEFMENSRYIKHLEIPVTGDVLVLAGDLFYLKDSIAPLNRLWKWASNNYRQVLLVPGNHEYYNFCDVMERGLQWKWMFLENVGYYQNQVVRIDDTDFILSTLWSQINPVDEFFVWKGMNDFRQTLYDGKLLTPENYKEMHRFCREFVEKSIVESTAEHVVVVTHHLPTLQVVAPQHRGSILSSAFATECGEMIVSNQLGYVFQDEHLTGGFDPGKFLCDGGR